MTELRLPELGENVEVADVSAVLVAAGDVIEENQPVIEVETEKASLEVPSTIAGRVQEVRVKEGDKLKVGEVILVVDSGAAEEAKPAEAKPAEEEQPARKAKPAPPPPPSVVAFPGRKTSVEIGDPVPAAPSVRALARELGVDVREVTGSAAGGRITRDDVKAHAKSLIRRASAVGSPGVAIPAPALPDFGQWGEIEREPLTGIRRKTAEAMATAWAVVPHVTQFDHCDITQLESMRRKFNERPEATDRKLTLTAIAVKTAAAALRQFPKFNASLDLDRDEVVYKKYVHVGVAVDTQRGLLVPVIRDVDKIGLLQVAVQLNDVAERARGKKIKPDEMRGATFTVSNLGGLGTTWFSPIVNWPEVAILGIGRAETQAVYEDSEFAPRLILPLSLSYDHRLIDGADAARFLRWIAEALEQPLLLLLEDSDA